MKKILFAINDLGGGGAEKVLIKILEKINKKKYTPEIFLFFEEGVHLKKIRNIKIFSFYNSSFFNFRNNNIFFRKLSGLWIRTTYNFFINSKIISKFYIKKNYDIEVAFLEGDASVLISNRKTEAKKIAWVHIDLEKHRTMPVEKEREVYRAFDKIVCVSNASKHSILNLYPEYENKIEVIYNPIDKDEIIRKSNMTTEIFRNEKITLVTVGRLVPQKGYDLLLKAHKQLLEEGLDYDLVILGEGILRGELEDFIKKNKLEKNTKLLGFKSNPYPYIKNGDIFVVSSRFEGYSLVLAEALTLGKPIISTRCAGPEELLDNGKYGILIPTEDISALQKAMKKMIEEEELIKKYSQLAIDRSLIFNIKEIMRKIERILE